MNIHDSKLRSVHAIFRFANNMSIRPALAKLNHKDVRQRRRAVRHLFELDDPEALEGFENYYKTLTLGSETRPLKQ